MAHDRAEGTSSGNASGNPSAVRVLDQSYLDALKTLAQAGFPDAGAEEGAYAVECIGLRHLKPYLYAVSQRRAPGDATVKEACSLLMFDRRYQSILFKHIGTVETQMRAQYAHWMGVLHGPFSLYDETLFLRRENHAKSLAIFAEEAARKARKSKRVKNEIDANGGRLTLSTGMECTTLGTMSRLYANTADQKVASKIANSFCCTKAELSSWLKTLTDVRNICAHFDSYVTRKQIPSTPLKIADMPNANSNGTFYIVLLLIKLLSAQRARFSNPERTRNHELENEVRELAGLYSEAHSRPLSDIGFPDDWESLMEQAAQTHRQP